MSISMYSMTVPYYASMLGNLSHVLAKAEAWAAERKIDPAVLLNDRLAPDMLSLRWQVMLVTDHAKGAIARLGGYSSVPKQTISLRRTSCPNRQDP